MGSRKSWPDWLPPWFTPPVAVVAGVAIVLALFFVHGSVRADVSKPLDLTKILHGLSKEAQTAPEDDPTATASPSPSTSPSSLLSSFLSPFLSSSPSVSESPSPPSFDEQSAQTASSSPPLPSTVRDEGACGQETDADEFAESLDFGGAGELAEHLGLEGGKDQLARLLRDCNDLDDLATSLGFDTSEGLAAYLGLDDKRELTRILRYSSKVDELAELEELAKSRGLDRREFIRLLEDSTDDPGVLAKSLGYGTPDKLAEALDLDKDELTKVLNFETASGKSESAGDEFAIGEGKTAADDGEAATDEDGSAAEAPAGAGEEPPTASKSSPPAAKEPPPVTDGLSSPRTNSEPPTDEPPPTIEPPSPPASELPSPPASEPPISEPTTSEPPPGSTSIGN